MELEGGPTTTFDVICAGDATWTFRRAGLARIAEVVARRFQPGGGAVRTALALASRGVKVGLATVLQDDRAGRALVKSVAAAGVDVGGVRHTCSRGGLLLLEGTGEVVTRDVGEPIQIPTTWAAPVLLLSGVSPVVSHGAALMREARRARRAGSTVIVDVSAKWHVWMGHDGRVLRSLLREADVVRCTGADLSVLGVSQAEVRATLRDGAVLVVSDHEGTTRVSGPFGELTMSASGAGSSRTLLEEERTAAICAELARRPAEGADVPLWRRALAN